jgi:hypothetical protein
LNILDGTVIGQCMQRHRHQVSIGAGTGPRIGVQKGPL